MNIFLNYIKFNKNNCNKNTTLLMYDLNNNEFNNKPNHK